MRLSAFASKIAEHAQKDDFFMPSPGSSSPPSNRNSGLSDPVGGRVSPPPMPFHRNDGDTDSNASVDQSSADSSVVSIPSSGVASTRNSAVPIIADCLSKSLTDSSTATPLSRKAFFAWRSNAQRDGESVNDSEKLPKEVRTLLDSSIQSLNKLGFSEEVLEAILKEYSLTLSVELLENLLDQCIAQPLSEPNLTTIALWKKYSQNLRSLPEDVLNKLVGILLEKYGDTIPDTYLNPLLRIFTVPRDDSSVRDDKLEPLLSHMIFEKIGSMLDVSVHDSGCQDKALYFYQIFKQYGSDLMININNLSRLPKHVKFLFALCVLIDRHGSVQRGRDSYSTFDIPERPTRLLNMEIFPRELLGKVRHDQPLSLLAPMYAFVSAMVKTTIYSNFENAGFVIPKKGPLVPKFGHDYSFDNFFSMVERFRAPCVLLLAHVSKIAFEESETADTDRKVRVQTKYEQYPINFRPEAGVDNVICFAVSTFNLDQESQRHIGTSLCELSELKSMVSMWSKKTDREESGASSTHDISGMNVKILSGPFGRALSSLALNGDERLVCPVHVYSTTMRLLSKKMIEYNAHRGEEMLKLPRSETKKVGADV